MKSPSCIALLLFSAFFAATPANSKAEIQPTLKPVIICLDSETEWPPYYYHPANGQSEEEEHVGASIDLIHRVFEVLGIPFVIKQMPWPRVLAALNDPDSREFCEMSWDMSLNEDRLTWLLFTEPIYKIQSGGFYNKEKLPDLDSFWGLAQLFSYDICGIRGYDYSPIENLISIRVAREQQALDLVALGRCDIFISTIEPIVYGSKMGMYKLDENTDYLIGSGFERVMHAVVSAASPRGQRLHKRVGEALKQLRSAGEIERIFKKHLAKGTGF